MERVLRPIHDRFRRTIYQQTTPLQNPSQEKSSVIHKKCVECPEELTEIEVTNPTHPLYGRRFPLISVSHPPQGTPHVFVTYRQEIVLKIPLADTNLLEEPRQHAFTKLTLHTIEATISLAKECEELCHINLTGSGPDCQNNSSTRSQKNS